MHGHSLLCLNKTNPFRRFFHHMMTHPAFDWIILFFICLTTVALAMESPLIKDDDFLAKALKQLDIVMNGVFIFEMLVKIIAMGFLFNGQGSYLRDGWCILDFLIVMVSIYSMSN